MSAIAATARPTETLFAELDYRENDGVEVWLLWNCDADTLTVYVCDARADENFELAVPPGRAREVFQHPYAHR